MRWNDALEVSRQAAESLARWVDEHNELNEGVWQSERAEQARLLRCIFGNPFRPMQADGAWLRWNDATIVKIAEAIYEERCFGDLPILADALEDAGCDNADLLAHCREPGEHVRGCWVVDLLLGKS
jgi:hypothetical protein